jgi:periplasmic protein TonB
MSTERRRQERRVPKDFTYIRVGEDSGGRVLNVSEQGLCFEALSPIRYTESFPFWLSFNLIDRIDGEGAVVWVDTAKRTAGIRFMELSEYAREQIRAWMNEAPMEEAAVSVEGTEVIELPLGSETVELPLTAVESSESVSSNELAKVAEAPAAFSSEGTTAEEEGDARWESLPTREVSESFELTELVPLRRHLTAARMQFVRGILVGVGVGAVIVLPLFKYMSIRQKVASAVEIPGGPTGTVNAGSLTDALASKPVLEVPKPLSVAPVESKSRTRGTGASRTNLGGPMARSQPSVSPAASSGVQTESIVQPAANSPDGTQPAAGAASAGANIVSGAETAPAPANREVQRGVENGAPVTASTVTPPVSPSAVGPEERRGNSGQPPPLGGDVRPPKLIKSSTPAYPSLARTQRVSGDVQVDALIDTTGNVAVVKVLSGPLLLRRAATEAIRQWKYAPGMLDGTPTPMHVTVLLKFRIPNQ